MSEWGRTAAVARLDLTRPLETVSPEPGHDEVLLIVAVGERVVGQVFVEARGALEPADQLRAIDAELRQEVVAALVARRVSALAGLATVEAPEPSVAVVVCTRGRPDQLDTCLAALAELRRRPDEIVVVDNSDGDDATRAVCERHGVRHVIEPTPGQTRARNRGLLETTAELVAFTDDDCVPAAGWLDRLSSSFADPMVMCVTGYIGPLELETPAQYLFERHGGFERHPRRTVFDVTLRPPVLGAAIAGAGGNMIFRRTLFTEIGNFAEDLGPGTPARSSDDKYQFYRLLEAGYRIVHEPDRVVWHRHRRDLPGLRRALNDYGIAEFAYTTRCLREHRDPSALHVQRWWVGHIARELREAVGRRARPHLPLTLAFEELRGALAGPLALRRSHASREGIAPLPPPAAPPAAAPEAPRVAAEMPLLTVAVATHNRRESLRGVLEALSRQDVPAERYEVVVVVDGSSDGTAAMARAQAAPYELRVIEQPNRGLAAARNRGAAEARHPVVVFLDDDIRPRPGCLAAHAAAHAAAGEPHYALGYFPPALRGDALWPVTLRLWWEEHFRRKGSPAHRWSFFDLVDGNSSVAVRLLDELGGFDERFTGGRRQDYELGIRLLAAGVPVRFHRQACADHHLDASVGKALANARSEGRHDVLLARLHPQVRDRLLLAVVRERLAGGDAQPERGLAPLPASATLALLRALERTRRRRRWRQLLYEQLLRAYAQGAGEACGGTDGLRGMLGDADPPPPETVRLDRSDRAPVSDASHPVALELRHGDRVLGRVDATTPNQQWDWNTVMRRIEREARWPGPLAEALDALSGPPA